MRENTAGTIHHPEVVNGRSLWIDPEVRDILDMLQNGEPTLGWEGDKNLALFRTKDGRWELDRFENGTYHTFCVSKPGVELNASLIMRLVEHDLRRRSAEDLRLSVEKHNDARNAAVDSVAQEKLAESLHKVYWGASRDLYGKRPGFR